MIIYRHLIDRGGVGGRETKHLGKTIYRQPYVEDDWVGRARC